MYLVATWRIESKYLKEGVTRFVGPSGRYFGVVEMKVQLDVFLWLVLDAEHLVRVKTGRGLVREESPAQRRQVPVAQWL